MDRRSISNAKIGPLRALLATLALACALVLAGAPQVPAAEVDGTIIERHSDDFEGGESNFRYLLKRPGKSTLRLAGAKRSELIPGSKVEATGDLSGTTLHVDDIKPTGGNSTPKAASNDRKVAVVLLNFSNDTSEPWTPAQIDSTVFTGSGSVSAYFEEESTEQLKLIGNVVSTGDVFGWYTIDLDNSGCAFGAWEDAARAKAALAGDVLAGYHHYVFIWPDAPSCFWAGLAYLPGSTSYINGVPTLRVISHELGHNLSVHHASSYRCTDSNGQRTFLSSSCSASEYGDPFTVMGTSATYHSHALAKTQLGFLPSTNTRTVTGPGSYTLVNSEQNQPGQTQLLRLPRTVSSNGYVSQYYYLDLRQPYGSLFETFGPTDPVVNGVSIRLAPDTGSHVQALLLDANPGTSTFTDSALQLSQSAVDPITGVGFKTTAVSGGSATVEISGTPQSAPVDPAPDDPVPESGTSPTPPATGPQVTFSARAKRVLKRRRLTVIARCDRRCSLSAKATIRSGRFKRRLRKASGVFRAGQRARMTLKLSRKKAAAARKAFARGRRISVSLKLKARGTDGTVTRISKRIRVARR